MMVRFQMRKYTYDQNIQNCVIGETSVLDIPVPEAVEKAIKNGFLLENVGIVPDVSNGYSMDQFNHYVSVFLSNRIGE